MNLYIISNAKTEQALLSEAFTELKVSIKICDLIPDTSDFGADDFFIVSYNPNQAEDIRQLARTCSVYVICDEGVDPDPSYEEMYIKPLRLGQLVEHVTRAIMQHQTYKDLSPVSLGSYTLNPQTSLLEDEKDNSVRLTEKELAIILFLSKNKNVTRDVLLKNVWEYKNDIETHTLETHLYRLRQKIQKTFGHNFLVTSDDGYHLET